MDINSIANQAANAFNTAKDMVTDNISAVTEKATDLVEDIKSGEMKDNIVDGIVDLKDKATDTVVDTIEDIKSGEAKDRIVDGFTTIKIAAGDVATDAKEAVIDTVSAVQNKIDLN
jgi:hypothetical protein